MMTPEGLVRRVRLSFIEDEKSRLQNVNPRIKAGASPERRYEWLAAKRRLRAQRRMLFKSIALRNLAAGYIAAGMGGDDAVFDICSLITWLAILPMFSNGNLSPRALLQLIELKTQTRAAYVRQLREMSLRVTGKYADRLKQLSDEIAADSQALKLASGSPAEFHHDLIGDPANVGTRGGSKDPAGAWRGWFIRELRSRMPHIDVTPDKYATVAGLLTWAGIEGVTPMFACSTLTRS